MSATDIVVIPRERINAINELHGQCEASLTNGLAYARDCGMMLADVKKQVGHNNWLNWVEANFVATERTAQRYIKVAENWQSDVNPTRLSDLSQTAFLKSLQPEKTTQKQVTAMLQQATPALEQGPADEPAPGATIDGYSHNASVLDQHIFACTRLGDFRRDADRLIAEAGEPGLSQSTCADALREASGVYRIIAGELERLAQAVERG